MRAFPRTLGVGSSPQSSAASCGRFLGGGLAPALCLHGPQIRDSWSAAAPPGGPKFIADTCEGMVVYPFDCGSETVFACSETYYFLDKLREIKTCMICLSAIQTCKLTRGRNCMWKQSLRSCQGPMPSSAAVMGQSTARCVKTSLVPMRMLITTQKTPLFSASS